MKETEPLSESLRRVRSARFEDYAEALRASARRLGLHHVDEKAEFERMKDYLLNLYAGVTPARTVEGAGGHPVDYVPFDRQPGARGSPTIRASPPAAAMPDPEAAAHPDAGSPAPPPDPSPDVESRVKPVDAGPEGTVPMRRVTLEDLVRSGSLDHFLYGSHAAH